MTVDRQYRGTLLIFVCDTCGETQEFERVNFHEAWAALKDSGWTSTNRSGSWEHGCPDCGVGL